MATGSDVRAGGAYVEAFVKQDKLDSQLSDVNRKVRANVAVAKTLIGGVGQGAIGGGALAVGAIALVGRAALGFGKGFANPARQASMSTGEIVRAIKQLQPALRGAQSPVKELMSVFTGFGPKIVQNIGSVRTALKSMLSPEQYAGFDKLYKGLFEGSPRARKELEETRNAALNLGATMDWVGKKGPRKSQAKPHADYTYVKASYHPDGTIKRKAYVRRNKPAKDPFATSVLSPTSLGTGLTVATAATNNLGTAIAHVSQRSLMAEADGKKLAAVFDGTMTRAWNAAKSTLIGSPAQWAAMKGTIVANLFGSALERGMAKGALRAADAARVQLAKEKGFLPGKLAAAQVIARRLIPAGVGAAIGVALVSGAGPAALGLLGAAGTASIGATAVHAIAATAAAAAPVLTAALTSPFVLAAAAGARLVTKPRATIAGLASFARRVLGGLRGSLSGVGGAKAAGGIDQVGYAAMRTKGPLGQLSQVATGAHSTLSKLAGVGTKLAGSWVKVGAISAGIVGALSAAAGFSTGSLSGAFTSFSDLNPQQITKTSQALGLTVEQTSRLAAAAELGGSSMESVRSGLQHVNELVKDGSDSFVKYGLSLEGMKAASPERRLELVAQALSKISDPAKRAAAGVELLGTSDLGGVMADFDGLRSKATLLGGVLSGKDVAAGMEFKGALAEMHLASKSLGATLSAAVLPQLTKMVRTTTIIVSGVMDWAQRNRSLISTVFTVAKQVGLVIAAGTAAGAVLTKLAFLGPIVGMALAFLASPVGLVTAGIVAMAMSCESTRTAAIEAFNSILAAGTGMVGPIIDGFMTLKQDFHDTFGGIIDAMAAGNLELAAEIAIDGLKLVFARGWAVVHGGFLDFKNNLLAGWDNLIMRIKLAGEDLFPGFEAGWSDSVGFLQDAWTVFVNGIISGWDTAFGFLQKSLNYLKSLFMDAFDLEGANAKIDAGIKARSAKRGEEQEKLLGERNAIRAKHKNDVATKGLPATLQDENAEARKAREELSQQQKGDDQAAIAAAKEKLTLALIKAREERKERESAVKTAGVTGAETAKAGAREASNKGFEANDIRTKEGLSAIATTARGKNPMDKQLDLSSKSLAELKKQTDYQQKIWKQQQDGLIPAFPL